MAQYLPDERDFHMLPRAYICNLIYSIVGEPFLVWVAGRMAERNEKVRVEQNLVVDMDPEIAEIF